MFYRVDYLLAVLLTGFLLGTACSRLFSHIPSARLARGYYIAVVVILALRATAVIGIVLIAHPIWSRILGVSGDIGSLVFGFLFGLTLRRVHRLELLREPAIFSALCLAAGFGFIGNGYLNGTSMKSMSDFFLQCGYSVTFSKFIITMELLGGAALLVPWAVPFAAAGLSIDMFGAVVTHSHNGDPLNDSTGAIGQLIRLSAIAILWALQSSASPRSLRKRLIGSSLVALTCLAIAVGGSRLLRHTPATAPASSPGHS